MKNKKTLWIIIITLLLLVVLGFAIYSFIAGSAEKLSYQQFQDLLSQNKIVTSSLEEKIYNGVHVISGVYEKNGSPHRFVVGINNQQYDYLLNNPMFRDIVSQIVTNQEITSPIWTLAQSLLPVLIMVGVYVWIFSAMSKGGMGGGILGGKSSRPRQIKSDVKFSDVAGINEEKTELVELVDYLRNPNKYAMMGARVPKGVLMEGPPGTGKTLLAKAVAGEANVAFFTMAGSEFEEMFVGLGASRVRDLFGDAKKAAPCIIFIDEIDAVGRKRNTAMGSATNEQTLNQLLVEMDGFGSNSGVIVMAATNRVDVLDPALLRPGRFDRIIQISLPDIREREAILKLHARNKSVSPEIDWKRVAERTPGFSGAQLENVLNEAAILVVRNKRKMITLSDIDEAIDRVVGGPAKKSRAMTIQDKKVVSYHEAGHALIGLKLDSASKVQKVTIIPRGNAGGYTIMTPKDESNFSSKEDLFASIAGYLGGRAAEEIMFGKDKITTGAHDDLDKATNIARRMVTQFGMSSLGLTKYLTMQEESYGQTKGVYSDEVAYKIDIEINTILDNCYKIAHDIISKNLETLELIAESLRVLETITAEQIEYINKYNKLPNEVILEKERMEKEEKKKNAGEILEFEPDEDEKK
ncbi:ATP-dependent zinc metalloprotease FtsH [Spiroplasma turonicum]|uniref:ATP-dependent zinc metalloprotease FtsH n=1 Tax=Spiroplasma turonicum TaxID=216946 RepID=A0A0K1P4P9_9MOLU|nr:ATP-dependent zinc metalloprotease FtsH [Spiroplasma turonicum]AKU79258.1 cell division protein FtsH [Spiroplasma turonicum]ALX70281.1 cell division protein FtsH [Spiroplasma turonicum]